MEQSYVDERESSSSFDVKRFLTKVGKNYGWCIAAVVLCMAAAYTWLRVTVPLYQVAAFIQVQPPNEAANILGGSPFSSTGNANARNYPDVNGEIFKLQSAALIGEVVDSLKLDIKITPKGKVQVNREAAIAGIARRLIVAPVPKGGMGMLQVVMRDEKPERAQQIVNVLIYKYDLANYIFKNKALRSEIAFLDNRLATVNEELNTQENYVRNFKASNKINDVSSSANQLLSSLTSIDSKKSDNDYKESLLKLIEANIQAAGGREERINVPGLQDVDLANLVAKYNDLVSQKSNILEQGAPKDLRLPPINVKLESTRVHIVNRIASIRQELATSNNFLASQERSTTGRFVTLPEKEKDYIQVNRLLNIKQSLYVFLLQKKEDKNIEFASSGISGSRIVDWGVNGVQDPKPSIVYAAAFLAGLLLPVMVILIRFLLNKRIETPADIYKTTTLPIAGEIALVSRLEQEMVMKKDNVSPVAEQFRTLRTNMLYVNKGASAKVVLITSGISGEGKSFISLNLANTLAISNRKVVLVEFDLRNPGLSASLGAANTTGIANFLAEETDVASIIQPVTEYENLFFISSGNPLPANPGEIILNNRMQLLFDTLKKEFDFIILDTPPIEAVSDALALGKWADCSFFVIRHKYSLRSSLVRMNRLYEDQKIPRPGLIVNGIKPGEGFNNVHGYGYGYGDMTRMKRKKNKDRTNLKIA
ncbi:polysaccharide biosynthesis tyrosine autokinase [Pseudoflavitalea sp. X16]|uniref:GumC family protein n=1 Tax=Paraflavitalea devenefica TaxID=2716334 RepID=UPI001422F7AE|nr:polysaccharide biosynthesis tyrosine autokinase [Paraflavitalea devenefica]NII27383.1 polysaccharide biosynthesis tyrosine autokinase [Paraflavitalea devenefica]